MRSRSIKHHPRSETLAEYAAGGLDEARAVVIATHLTLCDECKTAVRDFEALGGVVMESVEPEALSDHALEDFWARAGEGVDNILPASTRPANDFDFGVAQPLQRYLKGGLDRINWKTAAPGLSQHILQADGYRPGVLRLLKIMPGTRMPKHSHQEGEFTLILRGAYEDEMGVFGPGDFADLDDHHTHSPMAIGDEPCICLIATNAPLKMKSMVGKVVQPFIGL
ncbi:MAG: ChrR family anti-sigma-E factor [Pseudomonadota bacterium]